MKWLFPCAVAAAMAAATAAHAEGCPRDGLGADATRLSAGTSALDYRLSPDPVAVGTPFAIEAVACLDGRAAPSRMRVDARMPMHGHGMNYRPEEHRLGPGHSRWEGMVFHMPGDWELVFDLYEGDRRVRMSRKVTIGP